MSGSDVPARFSDRSFECQKEKRRSWKNRLMPAGNKQKKKERKMICPICKKDIKDDAVFCVECGRRIPRCPSCGRVIERRMSFCTYDGTKLPEEVVAVFSEEKAVPDDPEEVFESESSENRGMAVPAMCIAAALIFLLAIGIGAHSIMGNQGSSNGNQSVKEEASVTEPAEETSVNTEKISSDETFEEKTEPEQRAASGGVLESEEEEESSLPVEYEHIYEVTAGDLSWVEARAACEEKGGYLATITSEEEYEKVCEAIGQTELTYLWIGGLLNPLTDSWEENGWITGEEWTYANWYPGEPSREDADGTKEYYLCLWNAKYDGEEIGWTFNDQRNDLVNAFPAVKGRVGYICEYEEPQ